jgi:hypothetical protein
MNRETAREAKGQKRKKERRGPAPKKMALRSGKQISKWIVTLYGEKALIYRDKDTARTELRRVIKQHLERLFLGSYNVIQEPLTGTDE